MTKWDLIHVALRELIKQWNSGHNLDYFSAGLEYPDHIGARCETVIKWDPKLPTDSQNHMEIPKAIRISKRGGGRFTCTIVDTATTLPHSKKDKDKFIEDEREFIWFRKLNRDFLRLYADIERYKRLKENNIFLNDLVKVFPRTFDGALLGDDYDE
jgi:hypothetical protein